MKDPERLAQIHAAINNPEVSLDLLCELIGDDDPEEMKRIMARTMSNMNMTDAKCYECGRIFDLLNEKQANEWHYGHDCEA